MLAKGINFRALSTVQTFTKICHSVKPRNFYDYLELPKTATQSEVRGAYFTLSMVYHSNKNKTEAAKIKFRRITKAYEVLSNFGHEKCIGTYYYNQITPTLDKEVAGDALAKFYKRYLVKRTHQRK